ncbi:LOW QUALITY PROTEIN: amino acid decarboxylase, partial [Streptomyces sp. C]
ALLTRTLAAEVLRHPARRRPPHHRRHRSQTSWPCSWPANATAPASPSCTARTPTTRSPAPPGSSGCPRPPPSPPPPAPKTPPPLTPPSQNAPGPVLVTATAGTTDAGLIDPLDALADVCERHRAELHVDAAYGGALAFSPRHRGKLNGLHRARSLTLDLHKLGWQPVAAGLLAVPDTTLLAPLAHQADYLNAADDTEAGLPDLLGRSVRTTRRPDAFKIAATLRSLGRDGLARLIDHTCATAHRLADILDAHPGFELHAHPTITTVLFRPTPTDDDRLAALRRTLLHDGTAVLGRATADGRLWLKATLLNPHTTTRDLDTLVALLEGSSHR